MKAIRFHARHDVRLDEVPMDEEPGFGEVLVAPILVGICGTDIHEYQSGPIFIPDQPHRFSGAQAPQIIGHEFSAKVVRVGPGVEGLHEGQRVSVQPQLGSKSGYFGSRNLYFLSDRSAIVGLTYKWGGMAERAILPDYCCIPMPDDITDAQGAMIEPAACSVHAIDRSGLKPGGSIMIAGAGAIGGLAILAAKAAGASVIIVSEPNPNRRQRVEGWGIATAVLDPAEPGFADKVRALTPEGIGVDAAIECSGNRRAFRDCLSLVRARGTVVQVGLAGETFEIDAFALTVRDVTLRGSVNYELDMWPRIFTMISSGILPVDLIRDENIPMSDIVKRGFEPLMDSTSSKMKILVGVE